MNEYQNLLQNFSQVPEGRAQYLITNWSGESGLVCVMNDKLIPMQVL